MKSKTAPSLAKEFADVESGKVAPGRVWVVTKRADGTVERRQRDPAEYQAERKALRSNDLRDLSAGISVALAADRPNPEPTALTVRRSFGVSQDRFANLLGIKPGTVRNWEQGRRKPTGPAKVLLDLFLIYPRAKEMILGGVAVKPLAKRDAAPLRTGRMDPSETLAEAARGTPRTKSRSRPSAENERGLTAKKRQSSMPTQKTGTSVKHRVP